VSSALRYRIKTVSEMTGIPRNTLIAWERRHGILASGRLANGYRLYSDEDVGFLRRLKAAVAGGTAISQALAALKLEAPAAAASPVGAAPVVAASDLNAVCDSLFTALMAFDRFAAERVVGSLAHVSYATVIDEVYVPLLRRVGVEWDAGNVTVAQERFASMFVREQLVAMLLRLGSRAPRGLHVACVTFPGDQHELAVLTFTVHLVLRGCRVTYLGADVPQVDLIDFIDRTRPDCLCVSVIMTVQENALVRFARAVRRAAPPAMRIIIGGSGLPPDRRSVRGVELVDSWRTLVLP